MRPTPAQRRARRARAFLVFAVSLLLLWSFQVPGRPAREAGGRTVQRGTSGRGVLVVDLEDNASAAEIEAFEARHGVDLEYSSPWSADEALLRGEVADVAGTLARLRDDPLVEVAEPAIQMQAFGYPDDPLWERQWNMRAIDVETGWRIGGGRGVTVAVIDTGVSPVEDLAGTTLLEGRSFVPGVDSAADDNGHGTHVAGTIAQTTNNGTGAVGVAPGVTLLPYKVLDRHGMGYADWIAAAIDDAVDRGADVINLSLGGGYAAVLHRAVDQATARGVVVVVAAGNEQSTDVGCPANARDAIAVSAVDQNGQLAWYSNHGAGVEIAAPGGDTRRSGGGILQDTVAAGGHDYRELQGTSMAAPHVAGAAAVLLGMGLAPEEVRETLFATATNGDVRGQHPHFGYGQLALGAAVERVQYGRNLLLWLVSGLLTSVLCHLGGLKLRQALPAIVAAMVTAGGIFFLPLAGGPPSGLLALFGQGLVHWPAQLIGPRWVHFPLWLSALVPALLVFAGGPLPFVGSIALGTAMGWGAVLLHGAITGSLAPWWMGFLGVGRMWLFVNAVLALSAGVAGIGVQRMLLDKERN